MGVAVAEASNAGVDDASLFVEASVYEGVIAPVLAPGFRVAIPNEGGFRRALVFGGSSNAVSAFADLRA